MSDRPPASFGQLANRSGASRKLLTKKALTAFPPQAGQTLEDNFPPAPAATAKPANAPSWSDEDEATFVALRQRRAASGCRRAGANAAQQTVIAGSIKPNPGTVSAVIVGIVEGTGEITRTDLVALMAAASYATAKAKPADKGWCQGYIAGAIRSGFLQVRPTSSTVAETEA